MRVIVSQGRSAPIKSSSLVEPHHPKTDAESHDAERIRDERILAEFVEHIEKMQQQNAQFNRTTEIADIFASLDREDNDLMRHFVTEMDMKYPDCNNLSLSDPISDDPMNDLLGVGVYEVPNTNFRQAESDSRRLTGDDDSENSSIGVGHSLTGLASGSNAELQSFTNQAERQRQVILELQKQLNSLTEIQLQLHRQKFLNEEAKRQTQTAQESESVKEARSSQMQSEIEEIETGSTGNLSPLKVSNEVNSHRLESVEARALQHNQKCVDTRSNSKVAVGVEHSRQLISRHLGQTNRKDNFERSLGKEKEVRPIVRVKMCNVAAEVDPVVVRNKSKTFSCPECDKAFTRRSDLNRHLRIHTGEKPFRCGECGTAFSQSGSLTIHRRIHSVERLFQCQICSVAFKHKNNLSRHLLIHTNEKPYKCDVCMKSFRQKNILSDHMNTHTGKRPYKCSVCKKTFRHKSNLNIHRKLHTVDTHQ